MFPTAPALLRRCLPIGLVALVATAIVAPLSAAAGTTVPAPSADAIASAEQAVLTLLNKDRTAAGGRYRG